MTFEQRREAALRLLDEAGVEPWSSRPRLWRLLWRLGAKIPPPLFMSAWARALFSALTFAIIWGTLMWILIWRAQKISPLAALASAVFVGFFVGGMSAALAARKRRKLSLPQWGQLR